MLARVEAARCEGRARERRAGARRIAGGAAFGRRRDLRRRPSRPLRGDRRGTEGRAAHGRRHVRSAPAGRARRRRRAARARSNAGSSCSRTRESRTSSSSRSTRSSPRSRRRSSPSRCCAGSERRRLPRGRRSASAAGREGDLDLLARLGFDVRRVPLVENVSSSRVRKLLHAGEPGPAAALLGRPPEVEGIVVRGDARGRGSGFPTANLDVPEDLLVPPDGVYAGCGARASCGRLDRDEPALRRRRAPGRGTPARLRRRPVRAAARGRALEPAPRAAPLRLARGARGRHRRRRRARARRRPARLIDAQESAPGRAVQPTRATSARGKSIRWLMRSPPANP